VKKRLISIVFTVGFLSYAYCEEPVQTTPVSTERAAKYKFVPAFEWLEALGFIKKEDVIKIAQQMIEKQYEEIKRLKKEQVFTQEEIAKLRFLIKHVISYK